MKIIHKIKLIYQKPFRSEIVNPFATVGYFFLVKLLSIHYRIRNFKNIVSSRNKCNKIKEKTIGKSVFVFANGPSLGDIDFSKVRSLIEGGKFDLIAINSFLSKSGGELKPTFAVFADNLHFNVSDKASQYFLDVNECEKNSIEYFVPLQYMDKHNDLQIGYNAFCDITSNSTENIFDSPGYYGVTAFHALRLAKYLNYESIYICGFDNSYFKDYEVDTSGSLMIKHRHYYDSEKSNIFVPSLYKNTSEFFFDTYRHFKYLEKIMEGNYRFKNIAKKTYINCVELDHSLDIYK